ncbi:MAG: sigma-70 family RNA polymerase sigma factor [Bacteroidaceae bacterium]|nr:sigma-70 family RNA polymerase sigma factor [Bacteroidaceae bacterium]
MTQAEFESILPRLRPLMLKVGRDFFGNKMDAEDVAQEGLLRLWKYCERLNPDMNIEALAVKVAKNVCIDYYKELVTNEAISPHEYYISDSSSADSKMLVHDMEDEVTAAINKLQPRERALFVARHIEDKSAKTIAEETGIPKPSVQSIISMARKKLLNDLKHLLRV